MKVKIEVELFSKTVILVTSSDELKRICSGNNDKHEFITINHGSTIYVLVSDLWDDLLCPMFIQCLSHEFNHAAMCVLGNTGIRFDFDNQETLCYTQDFLMRKAMERIVKNT